MLLASLLVPIAVVAIVMLTQRLRLPAFLAIMATVVVYGIAADMTFQSVGKAFGLGFTAALEQAGLLVVAGALVQALVLRQPLGTGTSALVGALAGLGASATGGLALLQPAGQDSPRRALGLALTLLAVSSLVAPSPIAVAAASVMKASNSDDAHGRAAACRHRRPAGLVVRGAPDPAHQRPRLARLDVARRLHPDRAPDRAVRGADAERAPGQGRQRANSISASASR